jgi:hypothetical protein
MEEVLGTVLDKHNGLAAARNDRGCGLPHEACRNEAYLGIVRRLLHSCHQATQMTSNESRAIPLHSACLCRGTSNDSAFFD